MEKTKKSESVMKRVLDKFLKVDANSAATFVMNQPKVPERLSKFRKVSK